VALNTTTLAHSDAVWGGRQPLHLVTLTGDIGNSPQAAPTLDAATGEAVK